LHRSDPYQDISDVCEVFLVFLLDVLYYLSDFNLLAQHELALL
jgi:hypothetical protein